MEPILTVRVLFVGGPLDQSLMTLSMDWIKKRRTYITQEPIRVPVGEGPPLESVTSIKTHAYYIEELKLISQGKLLIGRHESLNCDKMVTMVFEHYVARILGSFGTYSDCNYRQGDIINDF